MESSSSYTIWYVLAILAIIYVVIFLKNKKGVKRRKSRKFMEGKRQHDKNNEQ